GRHTRFSRDWSSDVCSSDLGGGLVEAAGAAFAAVVLVDPDVHDFVAVGGDVQFGDELAVVVAGLPDVVAAAVAVVVASAGGDRQHECPLWSAPRSTCGPLYT